MKRYYYSSSIESFKKEKMETILGQLMINNEFKSNDLQKNTWKQEIIILQNQLLFLKDGDISFEYTIPRMGHRIDVVIIINGIVFLLEFKVLNKDNTKYQKAYEDQVMDYALDLKYFHEASHNIYIVPIVVLPNGEKITYSFDTNSIMHDKITEVIRCNKENIGETILNVINKLPSNSMKFDEWANSKYSPTPTIIEAAQALYRNHSVLDISRNDAGAENLTKTTKAINSIIEKCKNKKEKAICFITGVPGAGKTLAGLNIANERHKFESDEHAVFLSGNGPLVDVLKNALAKDKAKRDDIDPANALRETKAFIQNIHKFRDDALDSKKPPIEKVAIFDEAQRAWNKKKLSNHMLQKKGKYSFEQSEPEFLINVMDRHKDWAVIICLVGGGQEIYKGEAGIEEWFNSLKNGFNNWKIYISNRITDQEYVGNTTIEEIFKGRDYNLIPDLHLGVSLRSFRSERISDFVKAVLDNENEKAKILNQILKEVYPIKLTRNFENAKRWIRDKARGSERYGLLASSEGKRLRGVGIWVPSEIKHVEWFLNGKEHVDSSFYLEVAASEFKVQGLEVDYAILAWDADYRYENGEFGYYRFRGTKWQHINNEISRRYLKMLIAF